MKELCLRAFIFRWNLDPLGNVLLGSVGALKGRGGPMAPQPTRLGNVRPSQACHSLSIRAPSSKEQRLLSVGSKTSAPPQLPFTIPHIPTNRDHKALNRGTLGGLGN